MGKAIKTLHTKIMTIKMKIYLTLFMTLILTACGNKNLNTNDTFSELVAKLKILDSSFSYDLMKQDDENYYHTNTKEDSLFTNFTVSIIGLLPDTAETYKIIYLYPGDDLYPTLRTFTKQGKLIDDQNICYNLCAGWDCTMDSCESLLTMTKKNTFERYLKAVTSDCDSVGEKISSTVRTQISRQNITVDKKGKIVFGQELNK